MHKHKLYLWPEKCKFEKTRIEYLGIIIISHDEVEMDLVKIAGVADWPMPSEGNLTILRRILDLDLAKGNPK
jgi:hypothetical protein